jgi:ribosomal protein S18 acetylase RimI-like enzyme
MTIRSVLPADLEALLRLYREVAARSGGIARAPDEITEAYINGNIQKALNGGMGLVVEHPDLAGELVGEIHCSAMEARIFRHTLSDLTIAIHPDFQGQGIGKSLFSRLLSDIEQSRPDILRVELFTAESNPRAMALYQKLGFEIEGRFRRRFTRDGRVFEDDIAMGWVRGL